MSQSELHRAFTQHIMLIIMSCHSHNVGSSCTRLRTAVRLFTSACDFDSGLQVSLRSSMDSLLDCLSGMRYAVGSGDASRIRSDAATYADTLCNLSRTACLTSSSSSSSYNIFGDLPDSALTDILVSDLPPTASNSV